MSGSTTLTGIVVAVVPDVFFSVTVRNAIRAAEYEARIVKSVADPPIHLEGEPPRLVIVDLGAVRGADDWESLSAIQSSGVPVLVFGPHKDVDGFRAAKSAGVSRVVSNGQFHADMVGFIKRYASGDVSLTGDDDLANEEAQGDDE